MTLFCALKYSHLNLKTHAVISGLRSSYICYFSVHYFDCCSIFWMKNLSPMALPVPQITTHQITTLVWALPCITFCSVNICCMSLNICLGDIGYMICDLCTCYRWRCLFDGLWHASLKEQVQLTKWGDSVTFSSVCVLKSTWL